MPRVQFLMVLNTQLYVLITSCRWCDIPQGEQPESKSSAHQWLKRWYEDGTLEKLTGRLLAMAEDKGLINWQCGAVDGSFSPRNWWWWRSQLGLPKGILIHRIIDGVWDASGGNYYPCQGWWETASPTNAEPKRSNPWVERCNILVKNFEITLANATAKLNQSFISLMIKRLTTSF